MANGEAGHPVSTALFLDGTYDIDFFHDKFIELADPTEYKPAMALMGSWLEWQRVRRQSSYFRNKVLEWLDELAIKQKSEAIERVRTLAEDPSKAASFQANKWLAEERYNGGTGGGRPNKKAQQRAAKEVAQQASDTEEEAKRVEEAMLGTTPATTTVQ